MLAKTLLSLLVLVFIGVTPMPLSYQLMQQAAAGLGDEVPPAPDTVDVFLSEFTAADSTDLNGFSPDLGDAFAVVRGSMEIQSGKAIVTAPQSTAIAYTKYGSGRVSVLFKCADATYDYAPSIIFSATSSNSYMFAYFQGDGFMGMYRHTYTGPALVQSGTWDADDQWHLGEVEYSENDVEVFIDGVSVMTYTKNEASDWYGTGIGIDGWSSGGLHDSFDSLTFTIPAGLEWFDFDDLGGVVFTDDFDDANGTSLTTTGWSDEFGIWTTESGHAENADDSGAVENNTVVYDLGTPDHGVQVIVTTPATDTFIGGVSGRWDNSNGYVEWEVNNRPAYVGPTGAGVWYRSGSLFHPIVTHELTPDYATSYTMRMWFRDNYVFAEIVELGIQVAAECNQFVTATKAGLYEANHAGSSLLGNHFDNFEAVA